MNFEKLFWDALETGDPSIALRQVIITLREEGIDKDTLIWELTEFREKTRNESEEDAVLGIIDSLVGWCSPHLRID